MSNSGKYLLHVLLFYICEFDAISISLKLMDVFWDTMGSTFSIEVETNLTISPVLDSMSLKYSLSNPEFGYIHGITNNPLRPDASFCYEDETKSN